MCLSTILKGLRTAHPSRPVLPVWNTATELSSRVKQPAWHAQLEDSTPSSRYRRLLVCHATTKATSKVPGKAQKDEGTMKANVAGVLLLGFTREEQEGLAEHAPQLFGDLPLLHVSGTMARSMTVGQLVQSLGGSQLQGPASETANSSAAGWDGIEGREDVSPARVVYLVGQAAQQMATEVNDVLVEVGVAPAVVGALQDRHTELPMEDVANALRAAHARYWELVRPLDLDLDGTTASTTQLAALEQLREARLVVSAAMDAGEVPSPQGGWRRDEGQLVVIDGLLSEGERGALLDWLTEPGHDHSGPPPASKWEMSCVDREGDAATWGLRPEVLAALESDPPPEMLALQTRLAALWPEYRMAHMPADALEPPEDGEGAAGLSAFVGNAVMHGDPCAWHDDADPATLPPSSPWVHCYGYYYNREPGRPRFVTLLLYLNEAWSEEQHAETLFADPAAQAGLFVRPAPGRVVLMDQDMSHRINAPSRAAAGAPRYSLVWKLVWFPSDDPTLPGGVRSAPTPSQVLLPGLCRPEWGTPMRFGSAGGHLGQLVWQK